jgi:hypothetical protein
MANDFPKDEQMLRLAAKVYISCSAGLTNGQNAGYQGKETGRVMIYTSRNLYFYFEQCTAHIFC